MCDTIDMLFVTKKHARQHFVTKSPVTIYCNFVRPFCILFDDRVPNIICVLCSVALSRTNTTNKAHKTYIRRFEMFPVAMRRLLMMLICFVFFLAGIWHFSDRSMFGALIVCAPLPEKGVLASCPN